MKSSPKRTKVILLYASAGAGHRSACEAINQSIRDLYPDLHVKMIDILDFMPRLVARLYSRGYLLVASKYPSLWYVIYAYGSDLSRFKPYGFWHRIFWQSLYGSLFEFFKDERPDHIISSHFHGGWAAGLYKRKYNGGCVVSTVITDYGLHPVWINSGQDIVFVATDELKAELSPFARHLGTERIEPVGIPIHPAFNSKKDISALKKKFQLDPQKPTLLLLGGMFPSGGIKNILLALTECHSAFQLILVAGKHYPVPEQIKGRFVEKGIKYQLYGYVDFMHELMAVSDLAITKGGALTTSECLASGLPLVIVRPYPGQEERNCDYLLENGAAVRVEQIPGLSHRIDGVLNEPGRLERMRASALKIARPDSSERIAKILFDSQK